MKKPTVIVGFLIFILLAYRFVDLPVAIYIHSFDLPSTFKIIQLISHIGLWELQLIFFLMLALLFRFIQKNKMYEARSWYLMGCVLIPNLFNLIIKFIFSRARPDLYFEANAFGFYWFQFQNDYWSFTSGHAVTVMGLAAGIGILFPRRYFYPALGLAFLVGISRILLDRHYISDALVGFYIGFLGGGLFTEYLKRRGNLKVLFLKRRSV
jgi:membrane-associated phospholipid phosphatase